ncbi:MAG TPA: hypothetical protein PLI60_08020, partial [Anaerolineaceae bacterium]|nr:hypothetical protein [Anaerolineaceae bacterium]
MKKTAIYFLLIGVLVTSLACGFSIGDTGENTEEPENEEEVIEEEETEEETAEEVEEAESTETPGVNFKATQDILATESARIAATKQAGDAVMTQQANTFYAEIERLYNDKVISTTEGEYYTLPDFYEEWAQLGWYQWYETGHSPANFVLKADMEYETASTITDWPAAGCGFVFRLQDSDNNYAIFYTLDGYVYMWAYEDGKYVEKGRGYYGKPSIPAGSAEIMLVTEGDMTYFYVDGTQIFKKKDSAFL